MPEAAGITPPPRRIGLWIATGVVIMLGSLLSELVLSGGHVGLRTCRVLARVSLFWPVLIGIGVLVASVAGPERLRAFHIAAVLRAGLTGMVLLCIAAAVSLNHPPLPLYMARRGHLVILGAIPFCAAVSIMQGWRLGRLGRRFRRSSGACRHCGYDLTGLHATTCPECGGRPDAPLTTPLR